METHLLGRGIVSWFAAMVPGKPEETFLSGLPPTVRVMGTRRLGLPYRDVDLFCPGDGAEEVGREILLPCLPPGVAVYWLETTSQVSGVTRRLQKIGAVSAEGRLVTLTANPASWYRDQEAEYGRAARLLEDELTRHFFLRLRAEGRKAEAYRTIGVRYAEERA